MNEKNELFKIARIKTNACEIDLVIKQLNEIKVFVEKFNLHNKTSKIKLKIIIENNSIDIGGIIEVVNNAADIILATKVAIDVFKSGYFKVKKIMKDYSQKKSKLKKQKTKKIDEKFGKSIILLDEQTGEEIIIPEFAYDYLKIRKHVNNSIKISNDAKNIEIAYFEKTEYEIIFSPEVNKYISDDAQLYAKLNGIEIFEESLDDQEISFKDFKYLEKTLSKSLRTPMYNDYKIKKISYTKKAETKFNPRKYNLDKNINLAKIICSITLIKWIEGDKWYCEIIVNDIIKYERPDEPVTKDYF